MDYRHQIAVVCIRCIFTVFTDNIQPLFLLRSLEDMYLGFIRVGLFEIECQTVKAGQSADGGIFIG